MDESESDPDNGTAFCTWTFALDAGTGGGLLPLPPPEVDGPASVGFKSVVTLFALEAGTGGGLLPPPPPPDSPASIGFKSVVALFALEAGTGGGLNEVDSESLEAAL